MAGKTGSSNVLEKTGYNSQKTNSCFLAFITNKLNKPKYMVYIHLIEPQRIEETHGYNTAGWNASVLCRKIMANIANITTLSPKKGLRKQGLHKILCEA